MKVLKKIIIWIKNIFLLGLFCFFIHGLFWHNFYSHSLYYVKHIPRDEGYYPELVLFVQRYENMPYRGKTAYEKDFFDGNIFNEDNTYCASKLLDRIYFSDRKQIKNYFLEGNGKIQSYYGFHDFEAKKMTPSDRQEFERSLAEFLKPVEEATSKPLINLQWLFDKIYEGRFVDK